MPLVSTLYLTSPQSLNIDFPARGISITNPTGAGIYVRVGANDIPTRSNPDLFCPPYTFRSKTILPAQSFGFGLSSTVGPSSSQNPAVMIMLSDQPIQEQTATINLPNVAYTPAWAFSIKNLAAAGSLNVVPGQAGLSIVIYKLAVVYDNPVSAAIQFYWHTGTWTTASTVWAAYLWNVSGTGFALKRDTDSENFQPNGFPLAPGADLNIHNGDGANAQSPWCGVLYAYK